MNKLTVGLVFDDSLDKPDGVQQYVLTVGRWLAAQGHDVHYLVGETNRTDIADLHSLSRNVHVRFNQNRMAMPLPARRQPIRTVFTKVHFDILHVQVPYSPFLAGRIIKLAQPDTAVVGTFHVAPHSAMVTFANRLLALWVRGTLRRFDSMIGAPAAADFAKKTFGLTSTVIPLPLKLDPFFTAKPFERYPKGKTVVFLGRLVERKGCRYLLRAIAKAHKDGGLPDGTKVVICGGGPLAGELKQYVHAQDLGDIVEFAGHITEADKPRYLASADVVVYPSTGGESFGVVLLEALAASRGVVLAGNNPGYVSIMHPRPQSLFDPHDTAKLAKLIVAALSDNNMRTTVCNWQREYVQQFDVDVVGKQTLEVYKQALHKRLH